MRTNYRKVYEKVGYLFYAIAAADGQVRKEEIDSLRKALDYSWLPFEDSKDEYDTDAAEYVEIAFEYLVAEKTDPEEAYLTFEEYFKMHSTAFGKILRRKIIFTAYTIADSFRGQNRNETRFLSRMEKVLELESHALL